MKEENFYFGFYFKPGYMINMLKKVINSRNTSKLLINTIFEALREDYFSGNFLSMKDKNYLIKLILNKPKTDKKISVEIRHLQRTEVLEASEYFSKGQKGSSAMPHKRNPIGSENLSGLARLVRSNAAAAMNNVALWH